MSLETSEILADNTVEREMGYSNLPSSSLIDDIQTQLSVIFNSSVAQHRGNMSQHAAGAGDLSLIVYCPLEGGESIVDSTVDELAQRSNATVQTIDIVQYISNQSGSYWKDSKMGKGDESEPEAEKSSSDDSDSDSDDEDGKPSGYFKTRKPLDAAKLSSLIEASLTVEPETPESDDQSKPARRIVYLRDFGFMATFAPECYNKIVSNIQERQVRQSETPEISNRIPTAIIIGASPLPIHRGVFQKVAPKKKSSSRDSTPDILSLLKSLSSKLEEASQRLSNAEAWGEGQGAKKPRAQRLREQNRMWNAGTLVAHIHKQLAGTGVMSEVARGRSSRSKHMPTCIVVPATQNPEHERLAREKRRLELNGLHIRMMLLAAGGELCDADHSVKSESADNFTTHCKEHIVKAGDLKRVAERAVGTALASSPSDCPQFVPVSWAEYCSAWKIQEERDQERSKWLKSSKPVCIESKGDEDDASSESSDDSSSGSDDDKTKADDSKCKSDEVDPVVEKLKKKDLDSRQRRLLDCLIRPSDILTGFEEVHLPESTIDTVRTLVSLRMACPEAFKTGILKQYNMSGALLFGPPGTGKTLLAKAIAKESEARMIPIKPSDILDKCVGEEEKNIDALFKLARQLKPCIIFVDEVDALFGSRVAAREERSSRWRTDMLTQFTQEMDGMLSSDVIVIGATNRPFDLDDAIIRRLPCRMLIDLPDTNAREAILAILLKDEQLESDVNLTHLANLTSHFSGSDLKHVCVMAAYESAKEMANISWTNKKGKPSDSVLSSLGISNPVLSGSVSQNLTGFTPNVQSAGGLGASIEDEGQKPSNTASKGRRLSKQHFTLALKQVRASTSETQTSLVELRRWNEQFGSGSQTNRTGYSVSGLNRPEMSTLGSNASGMGASWRNSLGAHRPGMGGPGTGMQNMNMPNMNMSGTNVSGVNMSGMNMPGMNPSGTTASGMSYVPPVEGSYLRSPGVQIGT